MPPQSPPPPPDRILNALALALLFALGAVLAAHPLSHDDLFGHLATGELIVREGRVPRTDPFSHTRPGHPWVAHEWGFSLLAYGVYRTAGYEGLVALRILLALAILAALAGLASGAGTRARPEDSPHLAPLLALALGAVSRELILRAALVGQLLLAISLLLLLRGRRTGDRRALFALPALFLVWANLHSGVVFGLFLLGLFAAEAFLGRFAPRAGPRAELPRPPGPALYLGLFAACLALTFANPAGWELHLYPFRLGRLLFWSDIPWQLGHFGPADPRANPALYLLAGLLLAGLVPWRRPRPLPLAELLGAAAFLILALRSGRLAFEFTVVAVPLAAALHRDRLQALARSGGASRRLARLALAGATAVALAAVLAGAWRGRSAARIADHFPDGAVRFLERTGTGGRPFHHQNWGGYLRWRRGMPIFWDGRNDVFAGLAREVASLPFGTIVARYGVDHLLLGEGEHQGLAPELAGEGWALVHWDDFSALYLRRLPRFAPAIAAYELRLLPPFGPAPGLREMASDPQAAALVRRELRQVLRSSPRCQRALYFRGAISLYRGERERAARELAAAARIRPNPGVEEALARALEPPPPGPGS